MGICAEGGGEVDARRDLDLAPLFAGRGRERSERVRGQALRPLHPPKSRVASARPQSLVIVLGALPRPSPEALAALRLRPLPAKSGARLRKARQSLHPFARIWHRSDEAAIQAGVTIPGILHCWRMVGCFPWPLVLGLRLDFPSALGCECLQPLRGQRVHHGFRQPFGSRCSLPEIFNLAHGVTVWGQLPRSSGAPI